MNLTPNAYPAGTVRELLETDLLTPATRAALVPRLQRSRAVPRFFDEQSIALLRAVCARLIPQDLDPPIDIAGNIDNRLASGMGDGWRDDVLPPDGEAYELALRGLDESAMLLFGTNFVSLETKQMDTVLSDMQQGKAPGRTWSGISSVRFFEELLAEATEFYYSDPISLEEIGYAGMADAKGWTHIGLNQRDFQEPQQIGVLND